MSATFFILALLTVTGAVAAMTLRNLVHCALGLAASFAGLAAIYLELDAQFVGFAQLLIYVGAVAILMVFAILLTRGADSGPGPLLSKGWALGLSVAAAAFIVMAVVFVASGAIRQAGASAKEGSARQIGEALMSTYVLPLQVVGLLLTVALLGAVILALRERKSE